MRTDIPLKLSTVATQVEVTATADQLQTDTTTVENAVGEKVIESVANINQNPLYYAIAAGRRGGPFGNERLHVAAILRYRLRRPTMAVRR